MNAIRHLVPLLALLVLGACKELQVPNYNAGSITDLQQGANAAAIGAAAVGLLATSRDFETSFLQSHVALTGTFGREGMELDPSNPQHPVDRLDQIGVNEPSYAGWATGYRLIKQGNVILGALSTAVGMTDPQKKAVEGVVKTMQALALIRLLNVFDQAGLPIDVDIKTSDPAAPIAAKAAVQARIAQLLDDGATALSTAGASFVFTLPSGFTTATQGASLGTPSQFVKFNRALRARIAVYMAQYATALTAVGASFIDPTASLRFGAYDTYRNASGDRPNPLFDPTCRQLFAMPELETGAQLKANGQPDDRFTTKIRKFTAKVIHGYTVNSCWNLYSSADTPIPIIRNEELILIRAEARYFTGDTPGALADINLIRQTAGGLTALAGFASQTAFVDELLYNRLYSLMWEGGHRWVDMRRFNRLAQLPRELPRNFIFPYLPLPSDECLPRSNPAASCTPPAGL